MGEEQLQKILQNQARMEAQIESLNERVSDIKTLTDTVQKLAIALEKQGAALQTTQKTVDTVKQDVDEIKSKPAKRWESIVAALITGVVGFMLAKYGLK